jgi:biotin carboxylase
MRNKYRGKKLLLLGGASQHCKVVQAAREMGVYVLCVDYLEDSPAKLLSDEAYLIDVKNIDEIVKLCRLNNVDGVLNVCLDPCQIPYHQICSTLGLPCYGDEQQFSIMTNKKTFKNYCHQNGVDTIPEYSEYELMNNTAENIEFPLIVKPADSRGSRGQIICDNIDETRAAIPVSRKESSNGDVVIEQYMGHLSDFMVSYLIIDGEPHLIRASDRYLGNTEDGLEKVAIAAVTPSIYTQLFLDYVNDTVKKMIRRLGIKYGPFFMQGFVKDNTVLFYDPALRFPGSDFALSYKAITKINLMRMLIQFALTGTISGNCREIEDHLFLDGHYAVSLYPTVRAGTVHKILGMEKIGNMNNVISVFQRYKAGDQIEKTGDVRQRFCSVDMIAPNLNTLLESIHRVQECLEVKDENGKELLIGKMNTHWFKNEGTINIPASKTCPTFQMATEPVP